ncbi:hypothetical protein JB92DRAFT_3120783 [Gautieria morchelliformis]|nr:hypothetical protein JB92DRAFT_3120783 [Gautieria morchelliformis]
MAWPQEEVPSAEFHYELVDVGNELLVPLGAKFFVAGQQPGWFVIGPTESMTITNPAGIIELAVICNVCNGSAAAIEFIHSVIDEAVSDRKGVRPTHPGTLIQAGYNAGPHHLCVWGFVWNLKSKK